MAKKGILEREKKKQKKVAQNKMSKVQLRNRCWCCGRPRGYIRDFGLCRICFRKMSHEGEIPGVRKASW